MDIDNEPIQTNNFLPSPNQNNSKWEKSVEITQQLQRDFKDVITGIDCFGGSFSMLVKPDSKLYQAPQDMQFMPYKSHSKRS